MRLFSAATGAGSDLVLLHGWGMNNAVWSALVPRLAAGYRVTSIELPGHGASDYDPDSAGLDDWVDACLHVAPRHAHWLGWSLGGQIAQRAALRRPERIQSLILVCSSPRFVCGEGWANGMVEHTLRQFAATLRKDHRRALIRFLSLQVKGGDNARETLRLLRHEMGRRPAPNPLALEHGLDLLLQVDMRAQIHRLRCPSLWMLGDRDRLTPAGVLSDLKELGVPRGRLRLLQGSAHTPFLSHPDESLDLISDFLGGIDD